MVTLVTKHKFWETVTKETNIGVNIANMVLETKSTMLIIEAKASLINLVKSQVKFSQKLKYEQVLYCIFNK